MKWLLSRRRTSLVSAREQYNCRRLHEALGYRSPDEYETEYEAEHDSGPGGVKNIFGVRQCGAVAPKTESKTPSDYQLANDTFKA